MQKLVILTSLLVFTFVVSYLFMEHFKNKGVVFIDTTGQPYLGKANSSVELVLFEDFRCTNCQYFMEKIFPSINQKFVATEKIKFVIIPVSFIEGSKDLTNAALCMYSLKPESFLPFIKKASTLPLSKATKEKYIQIASQIENFPLLAFQSCVQQDHYYSRIQKNFELGNQVMNGDVLTPTLFINGRKLPNYSLETIHQRLEEELGR